MGVICNKTWNVTVNDDLQKVEFSTHLGRRKWMVDILNWSINFEEAIQYYRYLSLSWCDVMLDYLVWCPYYTVWKTTTFNPWIFHLFRNLFFLTMITEMIDTIIKKIRTVVVVIVVIAVVSATLPCSNCSNDRRTFLFFIMIDRDEIFETGKAWSIFNLLNQNWAV